MDSPQISQRKHTQSFQSSKQFSYNSMISISQPESDNITVNTAGTNTEEVFKALKMMRGTKLDKETPLERKARKKESIIRKQEARELVENKQ